MVNRIHCSSYNFDIATLLPLLFVSCSVCPCYVFASACVCVCHSRVFESCSVVLCSSCWCQNGSNTLSTLLVRVGWLAANSAGPNGAPPTPRPQADHEKHCEKSQSNNIRINIKYMCIINSRSIRKRELTNVVVGGCSEAWRDGSRRRRAGSRVFVLPVCLGMRASPQSDTTSDCH